MIDKFDFRFFIILFKYMDQLDENEFYYKEKEKEVSNIYIVWW